MSNHTPAPWIFEESFGDDTSEGLYIKADGECIASLSGNGYTDYANAALMAAAPEMLAVLRDLAYFVRTLPNVKQGRDNPLLKDAYAAIAKATGQEP